MQHSPVFNCIFKRRKEENYSQPDDPPERGKGYQLLNGLADSVMKGGSNLSYKLTFSVWPCPVCQQRYGNAGIKINPEGAATVSQVANGVR